MSARSRRSPSKRLAVGLERETPRAERSHLPVSLRRDRFRLRGLLFHRRIHPLHIHRDDLVFGAHGVLVAFAAGHDVHKVFGEVEGGVEDAGFHFVGDLGVDAHFAAGGEDADEIPGGDLLARGVGGVDGEDVLGDDAGVAGAAGHGAAIVVLQHSAGGEDEGEFAVVLHDFARFLECEEVEFAEAALEGVGVEDFGADAAFLNGSLLAVVAEFFVSVRASPH